MKILRDAPQLGCNSVIVPGTQSIIHELQRASQLDPPAGPECVQLHSPASLDCRFTILPAPSSALAALLTRRDLRYRVSTRAACLKSGASVEEGRQEKRI